MARLAIVALFASGCGGPGNGGARAGDSRPVFAPLTVDDGKLFDDAIEAAAVGLADVAVRPSADPALRARAQRAELVARVRVSTVSVDSAGGRPIYHVSLTMADRLIGGNLTSDQLELTMRPDSPSFGIVKWLDTGMIGKTFVGFFQRFAGADEPELRFHLSPDSQDVVTAVSLAKALRDVRGK